MKFKMFFIYCITNIQNLKKYIGWTSKSIENRFKRHIKYALVYESQNLLHRAIRCHGEQSFKIEKLEEVEEKSHALSREMFWIKNYKTNHFRWENNGYNMTDGGEGTIGHKHADEAKQKMSFAAKNNFKAHKKISQARMGHSVSAETRQKMSANSPAKKIGFEAAYGKEKADQIKQNISIANSGKLAGEKHFNSSLSDEAVLFIRQYPFVWGKSDKELAEKFQTSLKAIKKARSYNSYKHLP